MCRFYLDAISMLNNLISHLRSEKRIQKQDINTNNNSSCWFETCSWPLSSAMSKKFCFPTIQASLVFSLHLQFAARNSTLTVYKRCTESGQEHWLIKLHTNCLRAIWHLLSLPMGKIKKKLKNFISLQTRSRRAAVSCFRVWF